MSRLPSSMAKLSSLKAAESLADLARLLGFRPKAISYLLYKHPTDARYRTFQIPKRNGGQRTIQAPTERLKLLQRKLADLLQDCVDEINASTKRKDRIAHGFKRGRSIITNAHRHRRRRWVFNVDLEDFFPSINFGRVRGLLLKHRDFELHEPVATVIAQIACYQNSLPQGSPCSPALSNLIAHVLDMRLVKLASESSCTYSRYADDLTFSTNEKDFPESIAVRSQATSHHWVPGTELQRVVERAGFRINAKKTRLMYRDSRQEVTGLVVNKKVSVCWEYRHRVRAMVHRLVNTGAFELFGATKDKDGQAVLRKRSGSLRELHGMLGFIDAIDKSAKKKRTTKRIPDTRSSDEKVYREFLMYSLFYATDVPIVICEGSTDNIYLTHAIRSLAADFPTLAEITPNAMIRLKVRLFKYPHSSTARILDLGDGGSGVLSRFISAYCKETSRFSAPGLQNPVIILYDNDSGARSIKNTLKHVATRAARSTKPFLHVRRNLYAMPTPLVGGVNESKIEDFFDRSTLSTIIDGKKFSADNNFDREKYYGKKEFAEKVVRRNADRIDFRGFHPLLVNLTAAIIAHRTSSMVPPEDP